LKSLFSVEDVKLPPWSNGMCLAEYLPALEESLNLLVSQADVVLHFPCLFMSTPCI